MKSKYELHIEFIEIERRVRAMTPSEAINRCREIERPRAPEDGSILEIAERTALQAYELGLISGIHGRAMDRLLRKDRSRASRRQVKSIGEIVRSFMDGDDDDE